MQFEFKVNLKKVRHASPKYHMARIVNEPRLRQQLVLAHHIERIFAEGKAKDYGQIAGWLHISHPRIIQIVTLTLLAPDIQKEILLSTDDKINNLPEYIIWQKLTNTSLPSNQIGLNAPNLELPQIPS